MKPVSQYRCFLCRFGPRSETAAPVVQGRPTEVFMFGSSRGRRSTDGVHLGQHQSSREIFARSGEIARVEVSLTPGLET
jgi:hypothetical protein